MQVKVSVSGKATIVAIEGRLDATAAESFGEELDSVLYCKPKAVLVDISALDYVSSAGLRGILGLVRKADTAKIPLAFCSPTPLVNEVLEIAGFFDILKIHKTREEALVALEA
jgi:anti-anti-sigma factor